MIKVFRKIRQKMLTENKFSKYLLYAIGEIVLVTLGILIALTINQNNKDKNNNKLLDLYIIQLNDEIIHNIKNLNENKDNTIRTIAELDTLRYILVTKDYNNPKFLLKSGSLYDTYFFDPRTTTFENLKFSGDLKLFKDLILRNSISEAYHTFDLIKGQEKIDELVANTYYQDYGLANSIFINRTGSKNDFGKDPYFENTVIVRIVTLRQNRDAYEISIQALENLKIIFADL